MLSSKDTLKNGLGDGFCAKDWGFHGRWRILGVFDNVESFRFSFLSLWQKAQCHFQGRVRTGYLVLVHFFAWYVGREAEISGAAQTFEL